MSLDDRSSLYSRSGIPFYIASWFIGPLSVKQLLHVKLKKINLVLAFVDARRKNTFFQRVTMARLRQRKIILTCNHVCNRNKKKF